MKKGISLIVLVITIIVMIIIAGAIIISLNSTNIIDKANTAVDSSNEAELKSLVALTYMNKYVAYWEAKESADTTDDATNPKPTAALVAADPTVKAMLDQMNTDKAKLEYGLADHADGGVVVKRSVNGAASEQI